MATTIIRPISDNSIGNWLNSDDTTTDLYSYIDEETASDTDFIDVTVNNGNSSALFNFEDVSLSGSPINKVTLHIRKSSGFSKSYLATLVTNSFTYKVLLPSGTSGYEDFSIDFDRNPKTGEAWTQTEVNALVAGVNCKTYGTKDASGEVSQIYIEVTYGNDNPDLEVLSPGTATNDASIGTIAWNYVDNAKTQDTSRSSVSLKNNTSEESNYLKLTNFGFSIPAGATINGITVDIKKVPFNFNNYINDNEIKLVKADDTLSSINKADGSWDRYSEYYKEYGSSSDLWGETWTPDDINNSNFGVSISLIAVDGNATVDIEHVRIVVYYTDYTDSSNTSSFFQLF